MVAPPVPHVSVGAGARRRLALGLAAMALGSSGAFLCGCRKEAPTSRDDAGPPAASANAADEGAAASASSSGAADDSSSDGDPAGLYAPRAGAGGRDAGDVDPACDGVELALLDAAVDPRCAIPEKEWAALSRSFDATDGGRGAGHGGATGALGGLRQEARREGDRIVVSLVNGGSAPLLVPLRYHPGRPELAFSVLAESDAKAVFELAPPTAEAAPDPSSRGARVAARRVGLLGLDGGLAFHRVHVAHIRLAPGGAARARLTIDPRIVSRLDRRCGDARDAASGTSGAPSSSRDGGRGDAGSTDACLPARLAPGPVVLYVGQLVAAVDAGEPARIAWEVP